RLVGDVGGSVAVHAGTRLLNDDLALGVFLVFQHVGVAALFAEVGGEGIAGPYGSEAGVDFGFRLRGDGARVLLCGRMRGGDAAAVFRRLHLFRHEIALVIERIDFAPDSRIVDVVGDLRQV